MLEGGSAQQYNESCIREGSGLSRQIAVGDRLLAIDDTPCACCSVSAERVRQDGEGMVGGRENRRRKPVSQVTVSNEERDGIGEP